ncbi:MAG: CopG domain protein DNA-binding domain protein [Myxococcaceae bacterium]|nr:CopG domain protein DNA-binding domain protein [Myxococcaceae bacterium]
MSLMPIDLDAEAILFDGQWSTRDDLARRIKSMLDSGDYSIARQSTALEQLTQTLASVRTLAFRATPDLVEALNMAAARSGKSVGGFIRDTLIDNISGAPEVAQAHPNEAAAAPRVPTEPEMPAVATAAAPALAPVAIPPPLPAAPAQVLAGPGALKAAGVAVPPADVTMMGGSKDATLTHMPSVVVEPALAGETAVELTNPKKKDEESERRWFNQ